MDILNQRKGISLWVMGALLCFLISCRSGNNHDIDQSVTVYQGAFGTCCNDLKAAMDTSVIPNSFFLVNEKNVLYQTVGYANTEQGGGYFDQAVMYCPFCGKKLQDKDEIIKKSK